MGGMSVPAISARAGQDMIQRQREIEQELRDYLAQQDRYITQLERTLAERDRA
jgi:hypothetical protein